MGRERRQGPRLYLDHDLEGSALRLDEREAHYLGRVLRLKPGAGVRLFNGRGREREAVVQRLHRGGAELDLADHAAPLPESTLSLILIQAVTKSEPMDLIVQKATELGVSAILPVLTEYGVVKLEGARAGSRVLHWQRIARSACEQSGRHRPPAIAEPAPLAHVLAGLPEREEKLALHPEAPSSFSEWAARRTDSPRSTLYVASGPEGGFSARDLGLLDDGGFEHVRLGPRVLRAETAAIVGCALAQMHWGDLA